MKAALVIVDQQADFEPGGSLAVAGGDEIAAPISELMKEFETVVVTQDSHPAGHISFASSYQNKKPFEILSLKEVEAGQIESRFDREILIRYLNSLENKTQVLWPDHAVTGTKGWFINPKISLERATMILRKGTRLHCDSYSTFFENDRTSTGLSDFLKSRGVRKVVLVGLAGDYCVGWSALDARKLGFEVEVRLHLTRFVGIPIGSKESILSQMRDAGVQIVD